MNTDAPNNPSVPTPAAQDTGSPWQRFKNKRIAYLTIPLLVMATITEFVILATGWKYQQLVCVPSGMGVTFFGIGPIGATILAVELLKLPLAIWTASRRGWQKGMMLVFGLPLICLLTFQLVKDMAVYEMGVAMTPASQMLEKAMTEETRIIQLNGELAAIEQKKAERVQKLAELTAKQAQAKASLEELLKHNDQSRADAINLTEFEKKELSEVSTREAAIIQRFNADAEQAGKALTELRARREVELARASEWNAEEARIENEYKAKLADYTNLKTAYLKDRAEYDNASYLRRKFMKEPVDPGVAPERETNTVLKPVALAEIDAQIKTREQELQQINDKRRERVAQVEADARKVREEFDQRSSAKREEADRKRNELLAAQATLMTDWKAEQKEIDQELAVAVQKVGGIRAELDAARKNAEAAYEAREASIRQTQVHRIATTVEIVRGWIMGERPASIKSTAKERGDILTDQISMVRIWVYPVLAFIVAFLPTLLVEIGFSTVFQPEQQRRAHRLGFFGRHLHSLYIRAGRQKVLRAERLANEANAELARRDRALSAAKTAADKVLAEKESELQAVQEALTGTAARHKEQLKKKEQDHAAHLKAQEDEWVAKLAGMADSLNRAIIEKDALRDLQASEIERQIQMRQNAWTERLTQARQELDSQRAAFEAERAALIQAQHEKLLEVSEESKAQVVQARRQAADAELASRESVARLTHDLKAAIQARDAAESRLQQLTEEFSYKLSETREDVVREMEKALRLEKQHAEHLQEEFGKTLRQREEEFRHQAKQREHELALAANARLAEHQTRIEEESRRRELELARQFEARAAEMEARGKQDTQRRDETAEARLRHREEQLQALAETRLAETQRQADQELRRLRSEFERQLDVQTCEAQARLKQELQQKDDLFLAKSRRSDQQWQAKLDAVRAELAAQTEEILRQRQAVADASLRELGAQLRKEMQQKDEAAQSRARQREQELEALLAAQAEARLADARAQWERESEEKIRGAVEPLKAQLARTTKERDEARQALSTRARQVQAMEKKLSEASMFFSSWKNGDGNGNGNGNGNGEGHANPVYRA
ncbi:MAG: hypothetical protein AB1705_23520 [Verrucomicrobiota bacterium]